MKRWIGRWVLGVGLIHCLFGLVVFRSTWQTLFAEGLLNTVNGQAEREFPFWFLACGFLMILFGALIDWIEARPLLLPSFVGWGLLVFNVVVLFIMPISGGWLLLPASVGAVLAKSTSEAARL